MNITEKIENYLRIPALKPIDGEAVGLMREAVAEIDRLQDEIFHLRAENIQFKYALDQSEAKLKAVLDIIDRAERERIDRARALLGAGE